MEASATTSHALVPLLLQLSRAGPNIELAFARLDWLFTSAAAECRTAFLSSVNEGLQRIDSGSRDAMYRAALADLERALATIHSDFDLTDAFAALPPDLAESYIADIKAACTSAATRLQTRVTEFLLSAAEAQRHEQRLAWASSRKRQRELPSGGAPDNEQQPFAAPSAGAPAVVDTSAPSDNALPAASTDPGAAPKQPARATDIDMSDARAAGGEETGVGVGTEHEVEDPPGPEAVMDASDSETVGEPAPHHPADAPQVGCAKEWAHRVQEAVASRVAAAAAGGEAAADEVPERVRWAVLSLAEACEASTTGVVPADNADSIEAALNILVEVARSRRHGLLLVCSSLDAAITAIQAGLAHVTCPLDSACRCPTGPSWFLSLLATAQHVDGDATEPLAPSLTAIQPAAVLQQKGRPLFAVGPELLGQYVQRGRCHRFIALKSCRGFVAETQARQQVGDGEAVDAALESLTFSGATMKKGLDWEKLLNGVILQRQLNLCLLRPLYDGQPYQAASTEPPCVSCELVNLAKQAFDQGCDCGLKQSGGQFDRFERARMHEPQCGYQGKLEELSRAALFEPGTPGTCRLLYQATFDYHHHVGAYESVSSFANDSSLKQRAGSHMLRNDNGRVTIDSKQMAFSRLSPDYIALLFLPDGTTRVVVVDAKASAKVKVSHRIQVAFYTFVLTRLVKRDAAADAKLQVARWGCVWRPLLVPQRDGAPPAIEAGPPDVFAVDDLMATVERELFVSLPAVLSMPSFELLADGRANGQLCAGQTWHLQTSCQGCQFLPSCRAEAAASDEPRLRLRGIGRAGSDVLDKWLDDIEDTAGQGGSGTAATTRMSRLEHLLRPQPVGAPPPASPSLTEAAAGLHAERQAVLATQLGVPWKDDGSGLDLCLRVDTNAEHRKASEGRRGMAGLSCSTKLEAALLRSPVVRSGALSTSLPLPPAAASPERAEYGIFVSLATEPVARSVYAFCITTLQLNAATDAHVVSGVASRPMFAAGDGGALDANDVERNPHCLPPLHVILGLVVELHAALDARVGNPCCVYVLDDRERTALLACLAAIALEPSPETGGDRMAPIRSAAQRCLFAVMDSRVLQSGALEFGRPHVVHPIHKAWLLEADRPHLCCLATECARLVEVPAPGFAEWADYAEHVAPKGHDGGSQGAATLLLGGEPGSLRSCLDSCTNDATFQDWAVGLHGGGQRVAVLLARRCRLGHLLLKGLWNLLDTAGGTHKYLAHPAAQVASTEEAPRFRSACVGRFALFKLLELRGGALQLRDQRAALGKQSRQKTLRVHLVGNASARPPDKYGFADCEAAAEFTVPEADFNRTMAWFTDSRKSILACPSTGDGFLSSLRFPDTAVVEVECWKGAFCGPGIPKALKKELHLAQVQLDKPIAAALTCALVEGDASQLRQALNVQTVQDRPHLCKFTATLLFRSMLRAGEPVTALRPEEHLVEGCRLVLFPRLGDSFSPALVTHLARWVDAPLSVAAGDTRPWQLHLEGQLGCALWVQVDGGPLEVATLVGLKPDEQLADLIVVSSGTRKYLADVPAASIVAKFSLFRAIMAGDDERDEETATCVSPRENLQRTWLPVSGAPWDGALPTTAGDVAAKHVQLSSPTSKQAATFGGVLEQHLSCVWGPPGSGKSHWAGGALLALLDAFCAPGCSLPFRCLITAATNEAYRVALEKLEKQLNGHAAVKSQMRLWDLKNLAKGKEPVPEVLWGSRLCVLAGTVWDANKWLGPKAPSDKTDKWPKRGPSDAVPLLQLVLVDEASQMCASDAALVMDLLCPLTGRFVAVGDHKQLPPVVHCEYDNAEEDGYVGPPKPWSSLIDALRCAMRWRRGQEGEKHLGKCSLLDNHRMNAAAVAFCQHSHGGIYPDGYTLCDAGTSHQAAPVEAVASDLEEGELVEVAGPPPVVTCPCRVPPIFEDRRSGPQQGGGRLQLQPLALDALPWLHKALDPDAQLVTLRVPRPGRLGTRTEAALACELLSCARRCWPLGKDFAKEVAVVAPHHHQIAALREELSRVGIAGRAQPKINTVEKMQGQEAELVLILFGLTDAEAISAEASFIYALRRFNVAATRSRRKTVLLLSAAVEDGAMIEAHSLTAPVAEGIAMVRRFASVCRAGSAWAASPEDGRDMTAGAHIRGARYVKVFQPAAGQDDGTQRSDPPGSLPSGFISEMRSSLEHATQEEPAPADGYDDDPMDPLPAAGSDGLPDDDAGDARMQMEEPPVQGGPPSPDVQMPVFHPPHAAGHSHSAPPGAGHGPGLWDGVAVSSARRQLLGGGEAMSLMAQLPPGAMIAPAAEFPEPENPFRPFPSTAPAATPQRRSKTCRRCGETGHNSRTCPSRGCRT